MAEHAHTTSGADVRPELIDLDRRPDGMLLRLCGSLTKLYDAQECLEAAIASTVDALARIPALTPEGRRMKELAL